MITHDIEEALSLADEIYLLSTRPMSVSGRYVLTLPKPRNDHDPALTAMKADILKKLEGDLNHEPG